MRARARAAGRFRSRCRPGVGPGPARNMLPLRGRASGTARGVDVPLAGCHAQDRPRLAATSWHAGQERGQVACDGGIGPGKGRPNSTMPARRWRGRSSRLQRGRKRSTSRGKTSLRFNLTDCAPPISCAPPPSRVTVTSWRRVGQQFAPSAMRQRCTSWARRAADRACAGPSGVDQVRQRQVHVVATQHEVQRHADAG